MSILKYIHQRQAKFLILVSFLCLPTAKAEVTQFSWEPVPGATHYLLTIYNDDKDYFIRTKETKVFLDEHTRFALIALGPDGRILSRPDVKKFFPPSTYRSMMEEWKAKIRIVETPVREEAPPPALSPEQKKEIELIASLEKEKQAAFSSPGTKEVSIFLGAGFESLNSSGGTSTFKGSAMVGSTDLDMSLTPGSDPESHKPPYQLNAYFHTHTFSTKHEESVLSGETLQEKTLEYQQYILSLRFEYPLITFKRGILWATAGISLKQKPAMKINSEETGSGTLKDHPLIGPEFGLLWSGSQGQNLRHKVRLALTPWAPGLLTASFITLTYTIQYTLQKNLFVTGSINYNRDQYALSLSCPQGLTTSCQERSETKSIWNTLKAGLGLWF